VNTDGSLKTLTAAYTPFAFDSPDAQIFRFTQPAGDTMDMVEAGATGTGPQNVWDVGMDFRWRFIFQNRHDLGSTFGHTRTETLSLVEAGCKGKS
jgi:hypothetical protein